MNLDALFTGGGLSSLAGLSNTLGGGSSTSSGGSTSVSALASGISTVGSFFGPGGSLAAGALNTVLGYFGGSGSAPIAGAFAGHQSPSLGSLDASQVNAPDQATYLLLAQRHGISVEEVAVLLAFDMVRCGVSAQTIWDGYAAGTSDMKDLIGLYNRKGYAIIQTGILGPLKLGLSELPAVLNKLGRCEVVDLAFGGPMSPGTVAASAPALNWSPAASGGGASLMSLTGQTPAQQAGAVLAGAAQGGLNGAIKGATDAASATEMGQTMKKSYILDTIKENQGLSLLVAGGVAWVIKRAFFPSR